jgi:hypothetical protein
MPVSRHFSYPTCSNTRSKRPHFGNRHIYSRNCSPDDLRKPLRTDVLATYSSPTEVTESTLAPRNGGPLSPDEPSINKDGSTLTGHSRPSTMVANLISPAALLRVRCPLHVLTFSTWQGATLPGRGMLLGPLPRVKHAGRARGSRRAGLPPLPCGGVQEPPRGYARGAESECKAPCRRRPTSVQGHGHLFVQVRPGDHLPSRQGNSRSGAWCSTRRHDGSPSNAAGGVSGADLVTCALLYVGVNGVSRLRSHPEPGHTARADCPEGARV